MDRSTEKLFGDVLGDPSNLAALRELEARLQADPEACAAFVEYCQLHSDLYYLIAAEGSERRVLDDLGSLMLFPADGGSSFTTAGSHPAAPSHAASSPQRGDQAGPVKRLGKSLLGVLALAAGVMLLVSRFDASDPRVEGADVVAFREPTIVASIVSAEGAVWKETPYLAGQALRIGSQLHLVEGIVKVNMPTGAELVLEGPCRLLLDAPDRVVLEEGKVSAQVAEWASGFAVETSSLKVIDLGTQFAVTADADGTSEAHVLQGHVRIEPHVATDAARTSFLLGEGEAVRFDQARMQTTYLAAARERFITNYGDFRPYRPIAIFNTGVDLELGDEDPHWRITAGEVGADFRGPQYAVVCEPDERYLPNHPEVSQWMSVARNLRPGCLPNASYTFQTEFDLSDYDLSTVVILADILADNGVGAVRINGHPVDLLPWRDNQYLQEFRSFRRAEIVSGFVPGKNVIEIDVWNGIYLFDPDRAKSAPTPNPMAIRVEWQAFGIPLPTTKANDRTI